jgi:hypothetical protein
MFKPQPYDPAVGRRWLIACASIGAAMMVVVVLVAAGAVTPWLLYPFFVWFVVAVLGALLYGLGGLLTRLPPTPAPEPVANDDPRRYSAQRFHESELISRMDDKTHTETCELVQTVWGTVPQTLEEGGDLGEEWKLALGEGHWFIVARVL